MTTGGAGIGKGWKTLFYRGTVRYLLFYIIDLSPLFLKSKILFSKVEGGGHLGFSVFKELIRSINIQNLVNLLSPSVKGTCYLRNLGGGGLSNSKTTTNGLDKC